MAQLFTWAGFLAILGSLIFFCGLKEVKKKERLQGTTSIEAPKTDWRTIFRGSWEFFKSDKRIAIAWLAGITWKSLDVSSGTFGYPLYVD